ncbi:MAG: AIM24 family protein [Alphaproteobacteria bacterium]|nr:AIM24 family protein [Alphaproteobacteria bacterium]
MSNFWYLGINGNKIGPMEEAQAKAMAKEHPKALAWRQGFEQWRPVHEVHELAGIVYDPGQADTSQVPLMSMETRPAEAHDIEFRVFGHDLQFLEIFLDRSKGVIAQPGAFVYKDSAVKMEAIVGSGRSRGGFLSKIFAASRRVIAGERFFLTTFTNTSANKSKIAFGPPYPGRIMPINLKQSGGSIICQRSAFLCAARGIKIDFFFQRKLAVAIFGGEGFIMQKLIGDGLVFVHAGGMIKEFVLRPGETMDVETGSLVGFETTVSFDIAFAGGLKAQMFAGEGFFISRMTGPGRVWIQSMPFNHIVKEFFKVLGIDARKISRLR